MATIAQIAAKCHILTPLSPENTTGIRTPLYLQSLLWVPLTDCPRASGHDLRKRRLVKLDKAKFNFMALSTCARIRAETLNLRPSLRALGFFGRRDQKRFENDKITFDTWRAKVQQIPRSLVTRSTRFIFRGHYDQTHCADIPRQFLEYKNPSVRAIICQLQAAVKPSRLVLRATIAHHIWASTQGTVALKNLCQRGASLSCAGCAFVTYMILIGNATSVKAGIQKHYEQKFRAIRTHRDHCLCPIKFAIDCLLPGLERVTKDKLDLVDYMLKEGKVAAGAVTVED